LSKIFLSVILTFSRSGHFLEGIEAIEAIEAKKPIEPKELMISNYVQNLLQECVKPSQRFEN
jgi:hypothetical protein